MQKKIGLFAFRLIVVIMVNITVIGMVSWLPESEAVLRYGSTGGTVTEVQRRLKAWGYYTGAVDGIYGSKTVAAVKYFQSKNGLAVDGIAGSLTLAKIGVSVPTSGTSSRANDIALLARMISAEGRGEPYKGQVAIGAVIMNRIKHPSFPNTLAGVIYQPGAFSALSDGQFNNPVSESAKNAAQDAYNGVDPTYGCIYYYNPEKTTNKFMLARPTVVRIGKHNFTR